MDFLLLNDDDKSHYVYIKDFDRFMFHKTRTKNNFCRSCLQCFSSEKALEDCLNINGKQSIKLGEGIIEFENYSKQMPVPFKIYADFECNLRAVESYDGSYTKKYQDHVPYSFAYKVVFNDHKFTKPIVVYRDENPAYEFIKALPKKCKYSKQVINKHFIKNLIMNEEEEHLFQQSNSCWICKKLIDNDDQKVRDHCHVTGKFRGAAHGSCNINLQLIKKVPVIFHNLRGYDNHLIFNELEKI